MERIAEVDIVRGIAILFVYLSHSILYYPIELAGIYNWCGILETSLISFNMPLFFVISGLLFAKSKKPDKLILYNKTIRLLVPYLVVMTIITIAKFILPKSFAYKNLIDINIILKDIFLNGGDRWFVYVLFILFIIILIIRPLLQKKRNILILLALVATISITVKLPSVFLINKVVYFSFFFLTGMLLNNYNTSFRSLIIKYKYPIYLLFIVCNIGFVKQLNTVPVIGKYLLPIIGFSIFYLLSIQLQNISNQNNIINKIAGYIKYAGKYSLQFYLLSFAFPIIRYLIVVYLDITNPFLIISLVFILQLICITIIIEITKRITFLKIPFGY